MNRLSISRAWEETTALLRREAGLISTVALALLLLPATIFGALAPGVLLGTLQAGGTEILLILVISLIGLLGRLTIVRIALGPSTTLSEAFRLAARRLPATIGAFLLFALPFALATAPLAVPIMAEPTNPPAAASIGLLVVFILAFALGCRLLVMVVPATVAEGLGPFALLKRSWRLTAGNWWRIAGFILLFFVASYLTTRAVGAVVGSVLLVAGGEVEPLSVSALLLAVVLSVVGAAFSTVFAVMLARMYAQLAGGAAPVTVPASGS